MQGKFYRRAGKEGSGNWRGWKRITAVLSVIVAAVTISSLVLPAITMSEETCEIAEHQHTELCYAVSESRILHCSVQTPVAHHHDENCYDENNVLICQLPEVEEHIHGESCWKTEEADQGHTHDDECYEWIKSETLLCAQTAEEGHDAHTDSCYAYEQGALICAETEREAAEAMVSLICEKQEVQVHQHNETCFSTGEAALNCQIPEHTHTDECLVIEQDSSKQEEIPDEDVTLENTDEDKKEEAEEAEEAQSYTLVYEDSAYTITATYSDEANLPSDVTLSVKEFLPGTTEYENYYAQTMQALNNENILSARVFDIKFISDGEIVEPAVPVQIDIQYAEPMSSEEKITAGVVHFGEDGPEVLSAEMNENDQGVIGIVHEQAEFSPTPTNSKVRSVTAQSDSSITVYALLVENKDNGPNKLLVDWYVYLDKKWTKVGSTRTGWLAGQSGEEYDYISEEQAKYILEKYGFTGGDEGYKDLAYRMIDTYGAEPIMKPGIWGATGMTDGDGNHYYQLSTDTETDAYCVYFVPNTSSASDKIYGATGTEYTLYAAAGDVIGVYSVQVYDPKDIIYEEGEARPLSYVVHGREVSLTVETNTKEDSQWCLHRPSLVKIGTFEELEDWATCENNEDGTSTITLKNVTQPIYIADHASVHGSTEEIPSIPPDPLTVNYYIYIDDEWRHVGTTHTGWTIDGRNAANASYYDDPNYTAAGSTPDGDSFADEGTGYARDVISMSQVEDIFGKYGFQPAVEDGFVLREKTTKRCDDTYRIKNIGYQKVDENGEAYGGEANPDTIFFDTYYDSFGTTLVYPLSQYTVNGEAKSCGGYNIYYCPDGAATSSYADGIKDSTLQKLSKISRKDVEYYVYLEGSWTKVGTSHYLNEGVREKERDAVGISQMYEYLEPYGFPKKGPENACELFYVPSTGGFYNDTSIENGQYQLTFSQTRPNGAYKVYWLPTNSANEKTSTTINAANIDGTFYLFQVFEPSNSVYDSMALCPKVYVRHGQTGTLRVKPVNTEDGQNGMDWVVKGLDRGETLMTGSGSETITNSDGTSSTLGREKDETTGLWEYKFTNMQQTAIVAFPYSNGDRSLSNNYADNSKTASISNLVEDPNIQFTMHNYSTKINEYLKTLGLASFDDNNEVVMKSDNSGYQYTGQNTNQTYFSFRGAGGYEMSYSPYLDNDPFQKNHATVKRNLDSEGYPMLDVTHHGYTTAEKLQTKKFDIPAIEAWKTKADNPPSLAFLFGGGGATSTGQENVTAIQDNETTYVLNYMNNVNTPLQIINGKYQYFSYFNAADFNTAEQKWYVRDYIERTESTSSYLTKDDYGDFLPFNHSGGELVPGRYYNYYQEDVDYWFGMTMRMKFYMSENGVVDSGENMLFSFAGDDDVYVFIDDMLVLDVGGTHGSCTGTINFKTGLVQAYYDFNGETAGPKTLIGSTAAAKIKDPYDNNEYNRYYSTTIYDAYSAAMKESGMSEAEIYKKLNEIFVSTNEKVEDYYNNEYKVYRFKDYSTHDLDYFYMERGSAVANCNIQFNLSTLPTEALTVAKELNYGIENPTEDDKEFYTTAEKHSFRIIREDTLESLEGSKGYEYSVYKEDGTPAGTITADSNGIFQISAGQRVTASDINQWLEKENLNGYIVQELIPKNHALANTPVDINGDNVKGGSPVTIAGVEYIPYNYTANVGEGDNSVVFTPYTNKRDLTNAGYLVVKKDIGENDNSNTEFYVKVSINGTPVPEGTRFYPADENGVVLNDQKWIRADADGIIKIRAGISYRMGAKLIPDYKFTVEEVNIPDGWAFESYTVDNSTPTQTAEGTIVANNTHTVVVKNKTAAINLNIPISKQFVGMDKGDVKTRTGHFTAKQVTWNAEKKKYIDVAAPIITNPSISITCTGNEVHTANIQLAYPEGTVAGEYYYLIQEDDAIVQEGETFFKDQSVYIVKVTIGITEESKQTANITAIYKDDELIYGTDGGQTIENGSTTLAFVNRKGGAVLPETGGTGIFPYIFSGWAIIAIACVLIYKLKRE